MIKAGPVSPARWDRSSCQTASVTKGRKGWRSRSPPSRTCANTASGVRSPARSRTLLASTYQSKNSPQRQSAIRRPASPSWKSRSRPSTSALRPSRRDKIQRSSSGNSSLEGTSTTASPSSPSTKRAPFQSLLTKLRLPSSRSSVRRMSLPGVDPVASVKRNASVP